MRGVPERVMDEERCANPLCSCEAAGARGYCCEACLEQVAKGTASPCMCGHAACGGTVGESLMEG